MSTDLKGMRAKDNEVNNEAVVLVIHQEDEEEERYYDTASSSSSSSSLKSKVQISTFSGQQMQQPSHQEIMYFSTTPALDDKIEPKEGSNSPRNNMASPLDNDKVYSATTTPNKETAGGEEDEEDEEDEDTYTDQIMPCTRIVRASPGGQARKENEEEEEEEEEEDIYKIEKAPNLMKSRRRKKLKLWVMVEWIALVCIIWMLICSLTIAKLKRFKISELHLWKLCVLSLVIVCGRLFTEWFINGLAFLINRNFFLRKKLLYYVYELKRSVQICIWLGLVLLSWALLFHGRQQHVFHHVTRALVSIRVGAVIWLVKNTLIKSLAASVNVNSYFDRIQESFYHQYVLQMLSGPPLKENKTPGQLSVRFVTKGNGGEGQEMINIAKLRKLKQEKVSAWTMKLLSNVISNARLSTISRLDEELDGKEGEQQDVEITCEREAKAAAFRIFRNLAKPGCKYISEDDLLRFLRKEEVGKALSLFEGAAESGKIKKLMLRNWVVKVHVERKSLADALNNSQMAVKQLNRVASLIVLGLIVIVWLLLLGAVTTQLLLFISSIVFVFGNTAKVVFEGIIFVFVIRPFDVGDRCVIDEVQMVVEEMNIFSTVFLRYDNQKIYYPNAVLATKCIGNIYRSPFMGDSVEFSVDVSTTVETIVVLKARIKMYIISKPQHWNPNHSVVVLEIENMNKLKMALCVTHTMNHQNMGEKINRRSDLVFELKKIFDELFMKYHLLPQQVHVN